MSKVFVSYPIADKPHFQSLNSIYNCINSSKHEFYLHTIIGDSLIERVRNNSISIFLNDYPDYDYYCTVDDDIEICQKDYFDRLINRNLEFVGGLYPIKRGDNRLSSLPIEEPNENGLIQMLYLSSGSWCIKRKVLELLRDSYKNLWYDGEEQLEGKTVYGLCNPIIVTWKDENRSYRKLLSEDWSLCHRWRGIGGGIYGDMNIALNHIGYQKYKVWEILKDVPVAGFELKG